MPCVNPQVLKILSFAERLDSVPFMINKSLNVPKLCPTRKKGFLCKKSPNIFGLRVLAGAGRFTGNTYIWGGAPQIGGKSTLHLDLTTPQIDFVTLSKLAFPLRMEIAPKVLL